MLQPRGEADLALKALGPGAPQIGVQHLERDIAAMPEVVGEIDRGHPARAEGAHELISAAERLLQLLGKLHGTRRDVSPSEYAMPQPAAGANALYPGSLVPLSYCAV